MLIEAARRAEAAAKEMLALVTEGSVSCAEILEALAVSKAIAGVNSAFQVAGAATVAGRERHGDGGAEVLAASAGLSRREAHSQVKTAEALREVPEAFDAVAEGRVSATNAKQLAAAVERTSTSDVGSDSELLAKAESMRPEQFAREARRWVIDREDDDGESEHRRQRARRCVRVWDGDDGMVHLRGEFDSVTGRRIGTRLRAEAARMYDADKKNSKDSDSQRRSFQQCMADALDNLTTTNNGAGGGGKPIADVCVVAHVDDATGKLIAEIPGGDRLPATVLEELACNAKWTGMVYDARGAPLWQGHSKRTATAAQLKALKAIYGGCFACGTDFDMCQAHHVRPVSEGGPTDVDNSRLLGLPQQDPLLRLADPRPTRTAHPSPTRPGDLRPSPRPRKADPVRARPRVGSRFALALGSTADGRLIGPVGRRRSACAGRPRRCPGRSTRHSRPRWAITACERPSRPGH